MIASLHGLHLVPDVAGQGLVGPFARQGNLVPLLVHRLGQPQQGRARGIEHRALGGPDQLGERSGEPGSIHRRREEGRAQHRRGLGCLRALVGPGPVEADRERRNRLAALAVAKPEHDRRIKPAADVAHHRHVAAEPALDGLSQDRLELFDQRRRVVEPAFRAGVGEVEVPVAMLRDPAVTNLEKMPRRQRFDPLEEGPGRPRAEEREEMIDAARIRPGGDQPRGQNRLDLRAPDQPAVGLGVVERADPDPVSAQDERSRSFRSQSETANWPRASSNIPSPCLRRDGPTPRCRTAWPGDGRAARSSPSQLGIFEELAVECDPDRAVLVADRLLPPRQVDDRQPPGPERHARLEVELLVVGTAVGDRPGHRQQPLGENSRVPSDRMHRRCRT